jgi:hypothetical protein
MGREVRVQAGRKVNKNQKAALAEKKQKELPVKGIVK